jgi:ABC-2 type transport system ATP-binding protein
MDVASAAIELRSLTKRFGDQRALDDVSLVVQRGEVFGYLGPNGAGKTTTLKILTGLLKPTSGDVRVVGRSVIDEPLEVKARVGYVPESGALYEKLAPAEYLDLVARLYKMAPEAADAAIERWLRRFGLEAQRSVPMQSLSKGTRQKVCWIAALLHDPEVLILDEPLNALDVEAVALTKDLMSELSASGRTLFYSSHLMDVVARVCTRVAVLRAGRLVSSGTPDEVVSAAGTETLEQALLKLCREPAA